VPPSLVKPEDEAPFDGAGANIELAWRGSHTLRPDDYYELTLRYTHNGGQVALPVYLQEEFWFVDEGLHLRADQETERVYYWSVRLVRALTDAEGNEAYEPISPYSEERSFYWR
jgi:hypothetical protein